MTLSSEQLDELLAQLSRRARLGGYLLVMLGIAATINLVCAVWVLAQTCN